MEINYFSGLRFHIGVPKENVSLPPGINTPKQLIDWLCQQNGKYKALFSYISVIKIAVNGHIIKNPEGFIIKNDDKISFFTPMAGG